MLRSRYYIGFVKYRGVEYEGQHPPLITPELFERVQQRLAANRHAGERPYKRKHYLKGTVFCGRCQSRLLYFISTGNGGRYEYFHCSGQHNGRTSCGLPHLPVHLVEDKVATAYRHEQLTPGDVDELKAEIEADLGGYAERAIRERDGLTSRIQRIKRERYKWAEKAMQETVPDDIAQEKQRELGQQLLWAETELAKLDVDTADVRQLSQAALRLARDCQKSYVASPDDVRRQWNQAWWESIEFDVADGDPTVVKVNRTPVAEAIRNDVLNLRNTRSHQPEHREDTQNAETDVSLDVGSNFATLVGVTGLEPVTSRV